MQNLDVNEFLFMNDLTIIHEIDSLKNQIDDLRPIDKVQEERIMQKFRLDWNYNSNAIEGNSLDYGETAAFLMHGITAKGKPLKDYLDIKGHNEVIDYLLYIINHKEELSERDIRAMHQMLLVEPYENSAQTIDGIAVKKKIRIGEYKRTPNHVKTITGEIHYYASPEDTPILMGELMEWYRYVVKESKLHPVIIAAIFHHKFVSIHPFDDGNGRMTRLIMNLILMQYNYPPVIIKNTDKNNYYLSLSQADTGDVEPFVGFIASNMINSLNLYIRGAKGESIDEQSDLKKKLTLFKKEVESRGDKVEVKKSPEVLKIIFDKSIVPFVKELIVVLSDFKDLFFDYEEKFLYHQKGPTVSWTYINFNILNRLEEIFLNDKQKDEEILVFQFSNFKLAEDSFSTELKLSFFFSDLEYSVFYSFSDTNNLEGIVGNVYNQWVGSPLSRKFYHQEITLEEIKKLSNKIGEDFYNHIKTIFNKEKPFLPTLSNEQIVNLWNEFTDEYKGIDVNRLTDLYNTSSLEVSQDKKRVLIWLEKSFHNTLSFSERFALTNAFSVMLNNRSDSIIKILVDIML